MTYCSLPRPAHPNQSEVSPGVIPSPWDRSSHPSCPGVEKYPSFDSEKMVHLTHHALPLAACLVGTVICLLVWQMRSFQCVLIWLQVTWQSILGVLSRLFSNAFTFQLLHVQEYCFDRGLCPPLFS